MTEGVFIGKFKGDHIRTHHKRSKHGKIPYLSRLNKLSVGNMNPFINPLNHN